MVQLISSIVDIRTSCYAARLAAFSCPQKRCKALIFRGALPESKGELFRAIDTKLNTWKIQEGVRAGEKFWQWNGEVLRYLAFIMLAADETPTQKWLQFDQSYAELLLERFLQGRVKAPGEKAKEWIRDLIRYHLGHLENC